MDEPEVEQFLDTAMDGALRVYRELPPGEQAEVDQHVAAIRQELGSRGLPVTLGPLRTYVATLELTRRQKVQSNEMLLWIAHRVVACAVLRSQISH
jgi:hypothetical protein